MVTDPKVYVVEDDPGICECLRHLCASVNIPVETYARAEQFLETQNGGRAGCVVADVCLPGMSGFDLQHALARRNIRLPIIMITGYGDVPAAVRAMKAGAIDFIEKPFSGQLLLDSIAYALKVDGQVRSAEAQREQLGARFARLTPRERQVMELVVAGRTNRSIASEFGVSEKTVEIHRGQVMTKMKAAGLADLVRIATLLEREEG
jgi:FixJ family two-component response regulator